MPSNSTYLRFLLAFMLCLPLKAQIIPEQEYPYSATISTSLDGDFYYYLMDPDLNQCKIYSSTHSLYRTIPLEVPEGFVLFDLDFVSQTLFDPDPLLEVLFLSYQYVSSENGTGYYRYELNIVNEEGKNLLHVPGAGYAEILRPDSLQTKLLVYVYDYSVYPSSVHTLVYHLEPPVSAGLKEGLQSTCLGLPYPNPACEYVNVSWYSTGVKNSGELRLIDISGKVLQLKRLMESSGEQRLPVSGLPTGIYFLQYRKGLRMAEQKLMVKN